MAGVFGGHANVPVKSLVAEMKANTSNFKSFAMSYAKDIIVALIASNAFKDDEGEMLRSLGRVYLSILEKLQ
jgi:hypothetical protein